MNEAASRALFDEEVARLPRLASLRGWIVHSAVYPIIDVAFSQTARKGLRLRLKADGWHDQPPAVELLALDGSPLPSSDAPDYPGTVFNRSAHEITGQPFVCMVGTREYHTHPSHRPDLWENYRHLPKHGLLGLLTQLWEAWLKTK